MSERERARRPEPERTEPFRNLSTIFRNEPGPGDEQAGHEGQGATGEDPVGDGVRLGYRVIDDYLRYGERVARGFTGQPDRNRAEDAAGRGGAASHASQFDLIQDLLERTSRNASDWMELWLSQLSAFGAPYGAGRSDTQRPRPRANGSDDSRGFAGGLRVCVDSQLPVEVSYELREVSPDDVLCCHPLHAAGDEGPPLRAVSLDPPAGDEAVARLSVQVPPDQAAGVYTGVIVDAENGRLRGTICVEVSARTR